MIGRFFLGLVVIASLFWIGYVGFDILNVKSNFSETTIFSEDDGKVLIVNRPDEIRFELITGFENAPLYNLVKELDASAYEKAFVSFNRAQILLKRSDNWDKEKIQLLFANSSDEINFEGASFQYREYKGEFFKSNLYISSDEIAKNGQQYPDFSYDKKSTASVLEFSPNGEMKSVADIYIITEKLDEGEIVRFKTVDASLKQGKKIKDEVIFAPVVTKNFSSYHFFERDYFASIDSVFAEGPMSKWMQNGFVEVVYKGKKAIISDYIGGQDPILVLNDLIQSQEENKFSIPLSSNFPSAGNPYFVKYLADFVVISETETICDQLIADYKLGKTIALNPKVRDRLYARLPQSVSERLVSENKNYAHAVYQNYIIQTAFEGEQLIDVTENKETMMMNCEFDVADFRCLTKDGQIVVLSKENDLVMFQNGEMTWKHNIQSAIKGELQIIDLYSNKELFVLLNTENKIHLINQKGEYSSGFPITLDAEASNEVKFYRWKGKSYFIIATKNGKVILFDGKGRELNVFKGKQEITKKIDVWASQNKLFAGFSNDSFFEMFSLEKNKTHRDFELPVTMLTAKIPNELIQFGVENENLIKIDQKGSKYRYAKIPKGKLLKIEQLNKNPIIIVQVANEIQLFNHEGIVFGSIKLPFNEVEDVHIVTTANGKTIVAVLDGLENNVHLFKSNGEKVQDSVEGQTKVELQIQNNRLRLTSVIDQFIVQYYL